MARPSPRRSPPKAPLTRLRAALCASLSVAVVAASLAGSDVVAAGADLQVIVHPQSPLRGASRALVTDAFLKKTTRWEDGSAIRPVDQRGDAAVRQVFSERVLGRSIAAVKSYWQQRIFSGRDVPPPELDGDAAVVVYVLKTPGSIGYVSAAAKLEGAKSITVE